MNTENENISNDLDEIASFEAKKRRALASLLDEVSHVQNKFFATRGEMGEYEGLQGRSHKTPSFVVSHDLAWVGTNIEMGSDMPFIRNKMKDGKLIIDSENIDEIQQRMPDWSRQAELTAYLAHNQHRKFGTILAVISPGWINDTKHENWGADGRALRSAVTFEPLDSEGRIGLLNIDRSLVSVYALDGQHRVMGIKGLLDLQGNRLKLKDKAGNQKGEWAREDFFAQLKIDDFILQTMLAERLHVEYVPAILPGETRIEAVRRIRSVFYSLNTYAKKPTKGENLLLSETDGYALVARRVAVSHPLLKVKHDGDIRDRVNWQGSALPDTSEWFTTLEALKKMVEGVMVGLTPDLLEAFNPLKGIVELRPDDDQIERASQMFADFLDRVRLLPVFQAIDRAEKPLKELVRQRSFDNEGKGHLFLRPIGQQILADAVGQLVRDGMKVGAVFDTLTELDKNERFEAHRPESVWYGVTYDFHKNKMDTTQSHRDLAVELLVYLVRGAEEHKRQELERRLLPMRVVDVAKKQWRNFSGGNSTYEIELDEKGKEKFVSKDMLLPAPRS